MHADTAPALDQLATPVLWLDADGRIAGANRPARWLGGPARLPGPPAAGARSRGRCPGAGAGRTARREFARLRRVPMVFPGGGPARFADLLLSRREDGGWWLEAQPVDEFPPARIRRWRCPRRCRWPRSTRPRAAQSAGRDQGRGAVAGAAHARSRIRPRANSPAWIEAEVGRPPRCSTACSPTPARPFELLNIHAVLERVLRLAENDAGWR